MRCLALAAALRVRGAETRFVCRSHDGNLNGLVQESGNEIVALPVHNVAGSGAADAGYASWLGAGQSTDAEDTIGALRGHRPVWLVVDHYGLDAEWEHRLRPHVESLLVISDLVDRRHDCEILLNQNPSLVRGDAYAGRVPTTARVLLGPRYAMLRRQFAQNREKVRSRDGRVRRVLVYFGGTDPTNMTGLALEALAAEEFGGLEVDVVVGSNNPHRERLADQADNRSRTRMHGTGADMPELMALADLAIGAGGTTTLERLCLGLPSLVVSIAANQEPSCQALSERRLIKYLGADDSIDVPCMKAALKECLDGGVDLADMSARGRLEVDGLGAERVAELLIPTPASALRLRPAAAGDADVFFAWVNDAEVRRQSFDSDPIDWPTHRAWFSARLASRETRILVLEAAGIPVGQIRFDRDGDATHIDYSIDQAFRGRGWAKRLVMLGLEQMRSGSTKSFVAQVKAGNGASIAVFEGLGFSDRGADVSGLRIFRRDG
jgi:UDP-2,4-diacetamido-2,4,6-trideoxy-beta-L-altropyranose hydrolase